jgi:hypothetical protein
VPPAHSTRARCLRTPRTSLAGSPRLERAFGPQASWQGAHGGAGVGAASSAQAPVSGLGRSLLACGPFGARPASSLSSGLESRPAQSLPPRESQRKLFQRPAGAGPRPPSSAAPAPPLCPSRPRPLPHRPFPPSPVSGRPRPPSTQSGPSYLGRILTPRGCYPHSSLHMGARSTPQNGGQTPCVASVSPGT